MPAKYKLIPSQTEYIFPQKPYGLSGNMGLFEKWTKGLLQKQRGSYYIPETRPYLLHRGEQVIPAGKKQTGTMHVHVEPIHVKATLQTTSDIDAIGIKIGQAIAAGIIKGVDSEYEVG